MDSEPMSRDEVPAVTAAEEAPPSPPPAMAENGDAEARPRKKPRIGGELKRVAELVLVLATMARVRGGKKPTEAEIGMMAEARERLAELCEGLAPRDIAARDAVGAVIEDLGLNARAKEQKLGFRGPRLTIKERFSQLKRKMEETRKFPAQSSPFTSQQFQASFNTASTESRLISHAMRMTPSDKQIHPQISSMGTSSLPVGHVSTATSTSVQYQLPTNDVKPSIGPSSFPSSTNLRDSSSSALPRVDRAPLKLDGGPNVPSYSSQGQVNSSNLQLVNASARSVQAQAAKSGPEQVKQLNHASSKVDATAQVSVPRVIPPAPFVTQPAPGTFHAIHQPLQPMNFPQASPLPNSHNEIAKIVQKLLQPKLPDHPTWIPPSRDYMNKALTCQICNHIINDVDSVLICDACEKGYHIKCAQSSNQRGIPRGEWHCSRCLALSNGKPLPPKYGRVMRSNTLVKVPSINPGVQPPSEKKLGAVDPKVNQQNMAANGSSDQKVPTQTGSVAPDDTNAELAADVKGLNVSDTQKNNLPSISKNIDEKPILGGSANISLKSSEAASGAAIVESSESSSQLNKKSEASTCQEHFVELKPPPTNHLSETVGIDSKAEPSQPSHESRVIDQSEQPNTEDASKKSEESNEMVEETDKSNLNESTNCTLSSDIKRIEKDSDQANTIGSSATGSGITEHPGNSSEDLLSVEWIGDVIQVFEKKYYYPKCRVDGVTYQLQDHVLLPSLQGKLRPSMIKLMWEDSETGSKGVNATRYIFPSDLPVNVGRPCSTDSNEVYECRQEISMLVGYIKGPCEVLPPTKYEEESERRKQLVPEPNSGLQPIYICKWLYDDVKGSFQPVVSGYSE